MVVEVEVKVQLPDAEALHIKTLHLQNNFFDSTFGALASQRAVILFRSRDNDSLCILSLEAKPVLIDGVVVVEEDEEEIEASVGDSCIVEQSGLNSIESRILMRCKDEFGIVEGEGLWVWEALII